MPEIVLKIKVEMSEHLWVDDDNITGPSEDEQIEDYIEDLEKDLVACLAEYSDIDIEFEVD